MASALAECEDQHASLYECYGPLYGQCVPGRCQGEFYAIALLPCPTLQQDRTREFRFVSRMYAHLTMVKRSGHLQKLAVPNRDPDDITVPCVACPSPGFNLPDDWKETPEHLR